MSKLKSWQHCKSNDSTELSWNILCEKKTMALAHKSIQLCQDFVGKEGYSTPAAFVSYYLSFSMNVE